MIDAHEPKPGNRDELEPYVDTLLLAGELSDILALCPPVASDEFYNIWKARAIDAINVPIEISVEPLREMTINFQTKTDPESHVAHGDMALTLDFDDIVAGIDCPREDGDDLIPVSIYQVSTGKTLRSPYIARQQLSAIISRGLRWYNDPMFSDYTNPASPSSIEDIKMTLDQNKDISSASVRTYEFDGHEIIISLEDGHLHELSIDQPLALETPAALALRVTREPSKHGVELFHKYADGSQELPLTPQEIEAFRDILTEVISNLKKKITPPVSALDEDAVNQGLL